MDMRGGWLIFHAGGRDPSMISAGLMSTHYRLQNIFDCSDFDKHRELKKSDYMRISIRFKFFMENYFFHLFFIGDRNLCGNTGCDQ